MKEAERTLASAGTVTPVTERSATDLGATIREESPPRFLETAPDAGPEPAALSEQEPLPSTEPAPPSSSPSPPRAAGRGRSLALAGLGIAVALAFGGYEVWRHALHAPAKSAMPASTFLAISLDLKQLRAAEWFRRLTDNDAGRLVGLANLKTLCDYDATAFVDQIDVAIPEKGDHGDFGVVMEAKDHPLDDKALVACATKLATLHGPAGGAAAPGGATGAPSLHDRDGYSILQQDGVARFAMKPGGPYLTGRGAWLETMVDSAAGKTPSLDANPEHASLRAAASKALPVTSPAAVVASALLPPDVRSQVRAEMVGETDPSSAAAMDGVLGISGVGLAIGTRGPQTLLPSGAVDLTAELVDIAIELHCESPQACSEVAALIERKRDHFASDFRVRVLGFDSAMDSLEVHPDGAAVHLSLHINPERVVKALSRFGFGGRGPGGAPGARLPPGSGLLGGGGSASPAGGGFAGDDPNPSPFGTSAAPAPTVTASATATATAPPRTAPAHRPSPSPSPTERLQERLKLKEPAF